MTGRNPVPVKFSDLFRRFTDLRQMISFHVGKTGIKIGHPCGQDLIQMPFTEQKSSQTQPFSGSPKLIPFIFV